jgi:bifunctional UDP-N-acetylglucosamine pyrophosphorylase/glucosamine-1-phosphate N-acetyltransferase
MTSNIAAVVMAAGLGTRMRSAVPKHLHPLLGRRMVDWVIAAATDAGSDPTVVVASPTTADGFERVAVAIQEKPLGTGDAVRAARTMLEGAASDVLVLSGDVPLLTADLLAALLATHRREQATATVLSFEPDDARQYGRVVRGGDGRLARIVEAGDATPEELELRELNSSIYVFAGAALWPALERLQPHNVQGELYLTDVIGILVANGEPVAVHVADDPIEAEGVNTRVELAHAAAVLRARINREHQLAGVTIVDPQTTWIEPTVVLEPDVTVHPFTYLRGTTKVAGGAEINANVVAVDAEIGPEVVVGPFCYLRPGTVLEARAKAGTFVELKGSRIGENAKVPHLSYLGDAEVGAGTNIAAGNITANFKHEPGEPKAKTRIGRNVRTGVDNTFDAPVEIGDDVWLAPGAVITDDVPPGSLAGFAPRQETKEGWVYARHEHGNDD